jgi:hypothetical protein
MTKEEIRLNESQERTRHWKRWGSYLSERAWGTVREDYSATGEAWDYFPHDHARSRAYRWNEDGLAGICDRHQLLCFALALWNGNDPILKERIFGLTGTEGNHGEDVKEYYFYLDNTPCHSYMKYLYKYPHGAFPYAMLVEENRRRGREQPEFELFDTGVFAEDRYFDVFVEYAKADIEDICVRLTIANRGPQAAEAHLLPTLWFRNTWSWGTGEKEAILKAETVDAIRVAHAELGTYYLYFQAGGTAIFTENETNNERLWHAPNASPYTKDAFHRFLVNGQQDAINPERQGTKAAVHYKVTVPAGGQVSVKLRLAKQAALATPAQMLGTDFDHTFALRKAEADQFYDAVIPDSVDQDTRNIMRQALSGLLWTKQFYHYVVRDWLNGDPIYRPPEQRKTGRNHTWGHVYNSDVISMPDKWEYPWYAAWDLAFHCVALALIDADFAKEQLTLMLREWYMHPSGQIPAYEWAFSDVNPPVHAWAAYQVYLIDKKRNGGHGDTQFLSRIFHKLLLNFTWWVNRKDLDGMNVFQGGFLGLDNIGVFDRSATLPTGGHIEQSDGTSWMAMYSLDLLAIALELAAGDPAFEDVASKFWEHFVYIAHAMNHLGEDDSFSLWNEEDGFFYDVLHLPDGQHLPLRLRSMVGLIPLYAVQAMQPELLDSMPAFKRRLDWFVANRPDLTENMACMRTPGNKECRLFSIAGRGQLECILRVMLDENEFLSPCGIRGISRYHRDHPYILNLNDGPHAVHYEPGESSTGLFGGNSNWRGPIWFPVNYLLIQALCRFHEYYGDSFKVECPAGSGRLMNLHEVAQEIARRLVSTFQRDAHGRRPVFGANEKFQTDPHWRDYIPFHEYFHGDTGAGIGASHQTGWTALVASMIYELSADQSKPEQVLSSSRAGG